MDFDEEVEELNYGEIKQVIPESAKMVQEYAFKEADGSPGYFYILVDDESPKHEIQAEYDYWEEQLGLYDPPASQKKALWEVLAFLEDLLE